MVKGEINQLLHFSYAGRLFVKSTGKPSEILANLNKMVDYALDQEIDLFEVCEFRFFL